MLRLEQTNSTGGVSSKSTKRKAESFKVEWSGSFDDVSVSMAESLTCPVCFDLIIPPIYQCTEGHLLCSDCLEKLEASTDRLCPTCRSKLPEKRIRNLTGDHLAKLIPYPCPNRHFGCEVEVKLDQREEHLKNCQCMAVPCLEKDCKWQGKTKDYLEHLRSHPDVRVLAVGQYDASRDKVTLSNGLYFDTTGFRQQYQLVAWSWQDCTFLLCRESLLDCQLLRYTLRVAVVAGSPAEFLYEMKFSEQATGQSIEHKGQATPINPVTAGDSSSSFTSGRVHICLADALLFKKRSANTDAVVGSSPDQLWVDILIRRRV